MASSSKHPRTHPSSPVERLAGRLEEPTDYFRGIPAAPHVHPTQILCYTRSTAERLEASNRLDRDIHHRHVLIIPLRATADVSVDARTFSLEEKQALLIFPFQFHHYSRVSAEAIQWLFITFECGETDLLSALRSAGPVTLGRTAESHLANLLSAYQHKQDRPGVSLILELLLLQLAGSAPAAAPKKPRVSGSTSDESLLDAVNAWVLERMGERFAFAELAHAMGYSDSHLRSLFRERTGQSIGRHVRRLRLLKACQLLRNSKLRISEVAQQCAFDSVYSFSRAFRRTFQTTPSAYRQKMKTYPGAETR